MTGGAQMRTWTGVLAFGRTPPGGNDSVPGAAPLVGLHAEQDGAVPLAGPGDVALDRGGGEVVGNPPSPSYSSVVADLY
jgi:hypothetical protein